MGRGQVHKTDEFLISTILATPSRGKGVGGFWHSGSLRVNLLGADINKSCPTIFLWGDDKINVKICRLFLECRILSRS